MQSIDSTISTQLAAGETVVRGLIKFEFGTGTYGVVRDAVPVTYDSVTYQPGNLIEVSDISYSPGTTAQDFTIKLPMSGDDDLVIAALSAIYSETYQDRPVTVMDAHFNVSTNALINVITLRKGYIDRLVQREDKRMGTILEAECLSRAIDYSRRNGRLATNRDQKRRYDGDKFYANASKVRRVQYTWGRKRSKVNE